MFSSIRRRNVPPPPPPTLQGRTENSLHEAAEEGQESRLPLTNIPPLLRAPFQNVSQQRRALIPTIQTLLATIARHTQLQRLDTPRKKIIACILLIPFSSYFLTSIPLANTVSKILSITLLFQGLLTLVKADEEISASIASTRSLLHDAHQQRAEIIPATKTAIANLARNAKHQRLDSFEKKIIACILLTYFGSTLSQSFPTTSTAMKITSLLLFSKGLKNFLQKHPREPLFDHVTQRVASGVFDYLDENAQAHILIGMLGIKAHFPKLELFTYHWTLEKKRRIFHTVKQHTFTNQPVDVSRRLKLCVLSSLFSLDQKIDLIQKGEDIDFITLLYLSESSDFRQRVEKIITSRTKELLDKTQLTKEEKTIGEKKPASLTTNPLLITFSYLFELRKEKAKTLYTCPFSLEVMKEPISLIPCAHMADLSSVEKELNNPKYSAKNPSCPLCKKPVTTRRDDSQNIRSFDFEKLPKIKEEMQSLTSLEKVSLPQTRHPPELLKKSQKMLKIYSQ